MRINLGCGDNRLPPPWLNCDAEVNITKPLPWPDNSAQFIVIEHCVEHVDYYQAIEFFREARRVLRIGGVLRVTVPSLTQVMNCRDQEYFDWLHAKGWAPTPDDRGAMHAMLYCHGHRTAWNALLMEATLYFAGFDNPSKQQLGISSHPALCGVEGHAKVIGEKFNRIESITFEAAKMTGDLSCDYDEKFFAMHQPWKDEYKNLAKALVNELPHFDSAVDFGCGNGYLVDSLEDMGKEVLGIDGSKKATLQRPSTLVADITKPFDCLPHDLVICTEVAEHLAPQHADVLVDKLCHVARHTIFFSAAQAGHGGHLHLNEQPRQYWIDKFAKLDFEVDQQATDRIAAALRIANKKTWWFAQNCFVLRKRDPFRLMMERLPQNRNDQVELDSHQLPKLGIQFTDLPARRVAIVVGGSDRVREDVDRAIAFCNANNLAPEFYATNDMIQHFEGPIVAATLHPDKLAGWLNQRKDSGLPMPARVYSHDGGRHVGHASVTQKLRDWGGSSGLFGYIASRYDGHDRVILCGVPMTGDNHFLRKAKWSAVSVFTKAWETHKAEMMPYARSVSGGWTEQLFGEPTPEWARQSAEIAA